MDFRQMKGGGYYASHSSLQWQAIESIAPLIAYAIEKIELPPANTCFNIVDYGCADGRNSELAIKCALDNLHKRGVHRSVSIIENDLPTNDFNSLFEQLSSSAHWFKNAENPGGEAPFIYASAGTFYRQVMPACSVHFGFSSFAAHWLSCMPDAFMAEHTFHGNAPAEAREKIARRADLDWQTFLHHRAAELAPGARLVLNMPGRLGKGPGESTSNGESDISLRSCMEMVNEVLGEMVEQRMIERSKFEHFIWPFYFRTAEEIKRPLESQAFLKETLQLEQLRIVRLSCPLYERFKQEGDERKYADSYVDWLRAWSEATIYAHLLNGQSAGEALASLEHFYRCVRKKVIERPHAFVYDFFMIQLIVKCLKG